MSFSTFPFIIPFTSHLSLPAVVSAHPPAVDAERVVSAAGHQHGRVQALDYAAGHDPGAVAPLDRRVFQPIEPRAAVGVAMEVQLAVEQRGLA